MKSRANSNKYIDVRTLFEMVQEFSEGVANSYREYLLVDRLLCVLYFPTSPDYAVFLGTENVT